MRCSTYSEEDALAGRLPITPLARAFCTLITRARDQQAQHFHTKYSDNPHVRRDNDLKTITLTAEQHDKELTGGEGREAHTILVNIFRRLACPSSELPFGLFDKFTDATLGMRISLTQGTAGTAKNTFDIVDLVIFICES